MIGLQSCAFSLLLTSACATGAATLEQIISREDPRFRCPTARLSVGRDGLVYAVNGDVGRSFILRMTMDGAQKSGGYGGSSAQGVAANKDGVIGTANAHLERRFNLWDRSFQHVAFADDFLGSDALGWDAPGFDEAGASGDFYVLDQHRDRIVRVAATGKVIRSYALPHEPEGAEELIHEFRVCEAKEAFFLLVRNNMLRCVGFDGKKRWEKQMGIAPGWPYSGGNSGGFDVAEDGTLYTISAHGHAVGRFSSDGQPLGQIDPQMGDAKPAPGEHGFHELRVHGNDLLLKRHHPTELFQRYDLTTGIRKNVVHTDHERLTVTFADGTWLAGRTIPFAVKFSGNASPHWRVWGRPLESLDYREFELRDDQLHIPADCVGIWQIKVTPETQPWERGYIQHGERGGQSEYFVRAWVEIRQPDTHGSATVMTPENRTHYARGEEIPFSVIVRGETKPDKLKLVLHTSEGSVWSTNFSLSAVVTNTLPVSLTAALRTGRYTLVPEAPGLTCVPQPIVIGDPARRAPFHTTQYYDYGQMEPDATMPNSVDVTSADGERRRRLGVNHVVDRSGQNPGVLQWDGRAWLPLQELRKRLENDPQAIAPQKVTLPSVYSQTMAAFGASGIEEMSILMGNDAGLPIGDPGFDQRTHAQFAEAIQRVTKGFLPYPAFRGWDWAANSWIFKRSGARAAKTPEEEKAYEAALKRAKDEGKWDEVLDRVSGYRLGYLNDAIKSFDTTLREITTNLVSAVAAPHRNVEAYPPITFSNVDESDLQAQWEQIALPYACPHGVDFYKRPGKRAWTHPEIYNDSGTGDQILPTLFAAVMRGVDGVGCAGSIPAWKHFLGGIPDDSRLAYRGVPSVFRAFYEVMRRYGPWLTTLENNDQIAIVCSGRMFRIDEWKGQTGRHFARVFEAWAACLHAHHPARYVFVEDLKPDTLKRFKAVLVVDQTVEFEPGLLQALRDAKAASVAVFYDGTCREELVKEFTPLGVAFNQFENDPHAASDDHAYWRFPKYATAHRTALQAKLGAVAASPAMVENPEVFVSERVAGEGRFLWVVNNTSPSIDPGQLWRMNMSIATRVPVVADVSIRDVSGKVIYDVFAHKQATLPLRADLRSLPSRLYAILPKPIRDVRLNVPRKVKAGETFSWRVSVPGLKTSIPVRLRLLDSGGIIEERFVAADTEGTMTVPLNATGKLVLEATELFGGKTVRCTDFSRNLPPADPSNPTKVGTPNISDLFGPHLRDIALSSDGSLALINAMNYDHNLYAVNVRNGKLRWRQHVGHYWAFAPQATRDGFVVQGFDFHSAEGYHLYQIARDGSLGRRFALYGLPNRIGHWIIAAIINDRINQFIVPPSGEWIATAGDLGLAVWSRDGKLLWSRDWWKTGRRVVQLAALDANSFVVVEAGKATAYDAQTGNSLWSAEFVDPGEVWRVQASPDGKLLAVATPTNGGQVHLFRDGKLSETIPTLVNQMIFSPDGAALAVTTENHLKLYAVAAGDERGGDARPRSSPPATTGGLQWVFPADDVALFPKFSPDGKRLAFSTQLATLYVLDRHGDVLLERDLGSLHMPAWLPNGDLLLAGWMGDVRRLDRGYRERWHTRVAPVEDMRGNFLADDNAKETVRIASWSNAEPTPEPITPNLLAHTNVAITFKSAGSYGFRQPAAPLIDGKPDASAEPWLHWYEVGRLMIFDPPHSIVIDTYRTQLRVTGITLFEDPAHPESWLRDAPLEYFDATKQQWLPIMRLLSDASVHTHKFPQPVEASRFRINVPNIRVGNLRLGEIVLHGEPIGPAHPDIAAKRPLTVLFDEGDDFRDMFGGFSGPWEYRLDKPYSGGRYLFLNTDAHIFPHYIPPMLHAMPTWDFEIAENPQPGQYRWLQFAWKALSPETKTIAMMLGEDMPHSLGAPDFHAGPLEQRGDNRRVKLADAPSTEWTVVRYDLWEHFKRAVRIRSIAFTARGGPAAFDQIVLGRTEADLPPRR